MKFGVFLDYARSEGFEAVATGHYARIRSNDNGTRDILCGIDPNKNQTYFLALLNQDQALHALFPIGHLLKKELRDQADQLGLPNAKKKDSQGICFIGEVKMSDFYKITLMIVLVQIVNLDGEVLVRAPWFTFIHFGSAQRYRSPLEYLP